MNQRTLHTVEDIKRDLERQGKSIADLARELGLRPMIVYDLLGGRTCGTRGESFEAAKRLGLVGPEEDTADSRSPNPWPENDMQASRPLDCLLGLPHVDALSMNDGQIEPNPAPGVNVFRYSSLTITLHHTAHGVPPLLKLVRTLQSMPCVFRMPGPTDTITLRRADDGQAKPDGPCCLRFRIAENPDCEHCPLNTTSSNISEQR